MDALRVAYESAAPRMPWVTFDAFQSSLRDAEVHAVEVGGKVAGALIVIGPEVHACVMPWARGVWLTRRLLRVLHGVIVQHGYAVTSATTPDGVAFVRRLGFVQDGDKWVMYGH